MPSSSSTKPWAPASTTWALRSSSSWSVVAARERRARVSAAAKTGLKAAVGSALVRAWQFVGEIAQHGQQRAFAGLAQGVARVGGAGGCGVREVDGVERRLRAGLVGEAEQELREDRAGVAAGAVEGGVGDAHEQRAGMGLGLAIEGGEHGGEGHRQVGAGVAVGDREDVDLVEVVGLLEQAVDAGAQGVGEAQAVEGLGRCLIWTSASPPRTNGSALP